MHEIKQKINEINNEINREHLPMRIKYLSRSFIAMSTVTMVLVSNIPVVHAEGGGKRTHANWGVNRRVVTKPGYVEVEGVFNMNFELPKNSAGETIRGLYENSPSPYLGGIGTHTKGGTVHVDAGLQYDHVPGDIGIKGWGYFLRNSNPTNETAEVGYNQPAYWDAATGQSKAWKSGQTTNLNAFLNYKIFDGDKAGWFGLTIDQFPIGGRHTVYWKQRNFVTTVQSGGAASSNTLVVTSVGRMAVGGRITIGGGASEETRTVSAINPANKTITVSTSFSVSHTVGENITYEPVGTVTNVVTSVQSGGAQNTKTVVVSSVVGLEPRVPITIGTEVKIVQTIDPTTKTVSVTSNFSSNHAVNEVVRQELDVRRAYAGRLAAPWSGEEIFAPTKLDEARVKRVVAMTRDEDMADPAALDGATLWCEFSAGQVRQHDEATLNAWGADDVEQGGAADKQYTGFDAPANGSPNDAAWDMRRKTKTGSKKIDGQSKTIVEFLGLSVDNIIARYGADGTATQRDASYNATNSSNGASRYSHETVRINMRTAPATTGEKVTPKPKS